MGNVCECVYGSEGERERERERERDEKERARECRTIVCMCLCVYLGERLLKRPHPHDLIPPASPADGGILGTFDHRRLPIL